MRRLELIMNITMIVVAEIFYYLTLQLSEKAMIYPLFVITLLNNTFINPIIYSLF